MALTKRLAVELAPGVRVNCVCPSPVDTPMAAGIQLPSDVDISRLDRHPSLTGRRAEAGVTYLLDGGAAA